MVQVVQYPTIAEGTLRWRLFTEQPLEMQVGIGNRVSDNRAITYGVQLPKSQDGIELILTETVDSEGTVLTLTYPGGSSFKRLAATSDDEATLFFDVVAGRSTAAFRYGKKVQLAHCVLIDKDGQPVSNVNCVWIRVTLPRLPSGRASVSGGNE